MPYLNCPRCHLSISLARAGLAAPEYCPRCIARVGLATPLFSSPLTMQQLRAQEQAGADGVAPPRP